MSHTFISAMDRQHWTGYSCLIIVVLYKAYMVAFAGDMILVGLNKCAGRVQLSNGTRVCAEGWGLDEANALCKELKCAKSVAAGRSSFGSGSENLWLKNVKCSGSKVLLTQCREDSELSAEPCSQGDAAVVCSDGISGPDVSTQPASEVTWGDTIRITCKIPNEIHQLTQGTFKLIKSRETKTGQSSASFSVPNVKFEDEGEYKCCYQTAKIEFCSPVTFTVTVDLEKPTISASSADQQPWSSNRTQVTRGYSFVINCSTSENYPEGLFLLRFSGSNSSVREPSVNHSASFNFPVSQNQHQGQYSCVYQVTGAGRTYTSPESAVVMVIVKQPLLPIVLPVVLVSLLLLVLIVLYFIYRRRKHVTKLTTSTPAPMTTMNEYEESEDQEEPDYVNAPNERQGEDIEEPDYVNMTNINGICTAANDGVDNNIYQNF